MANSVRGSSGRKMTDEEAYERLPITLKRCLQEAVTEWCSYSVLKHFEKYGLPKTIDEIHRWDDYFMHKRLQSQRFKKADIRSSFIECKVKPLRVYGITRDTRVSQQR